MGFTKMNVLLLFKTEMNVTIYYSGVNTLFVNGKDIPKIENMKDLKINSFTQLNYDMGINLDNEWSTSHEKPGHLYKVECNLEDFMLLRQTNQNKHIDI